MLFRSVETFPDPWLIPVWPVKLGEGVVHVWRACLDVAERSGLNLAGKTLAPASAQLTLAREGGSVVARLSAGTTATRLAGYWAVLEDKHQTKVRAGENSGETLLHDHVVRLYKPVAPWTGDKAFSSQLSISAGDAANPRRAAFVVVDPATQRPLQAATLALPAGC